MGMCSGRLIGPYVFVDSVNSWKFFTMLSDWLLKQLQQIASFNDHTLIFRQDVAPLHWSRHAWLAGHQLSESLGWIGRGGLISWSACSLDLTPLDFWLGGWSQESSLRFKISHMWWAASANFWRSWKDRPRNAQKSTDRLSTATSCLPGE